MKRKEKQMESNKNARDEEEKKKKVLYQYRPTLMYTHSTSEMPSRQKSFESPVNVGLMIILYFLLVKPSLLPADLCISFTDFIYALI